MKKSLVVALVVLFTIICLYTFFPYRNNPYRNKQMQLARYLGVEINQRELGKSFPITYFDEKLTPGMSISEVHALIKGYDLVYRCGDYSEVYYYFEKSDTKALRFEVFYDEEQNYEELQSEDENSRYINVDSCIRNGLIEE